MSEPGEREKAAEAEAWSGVEGSSVVGGSARLAHVFGFKAGVAFARRTPGPATAKMVRLFGVLVRRAASLEIVDSEPIEIRMDGASAWISLADARAFVAELITRRSPAPAPATPRPDA